MLPVAIVAAAVAGLGVGVRSGGLHAESRSGIVDCRSIDERDQYCPADTRAGVRLVEQLSRAACEEGVTWGYDRRGIWVTNGCAGEFELVLHGVGQRSERDRYRHPGETAAAPTVVCESLDFRYRRCSASVKRHVDLVEQLSKSACRHGESWGWDANGVWVDRGCAAAFAIF